MFIAAPDFPCVGAKSALNKDRIRFGHHTAHADSASAFALSADLRHFSEAFVDPGNLPVSFIATFEASESTEKDFETRVWRHLQLMHDCDNRNYEWDPSVSQDPAHADFSFSIAGRAFLWWDYTLQLREWRGEHQCLVLYSIFMINSKRSKHPVNTRACNLRFAPGTPHCKAL